MNSDKQTGSYVYIPDGSQIMIGNNQIDEDTIDLLAFWRIYYKYKWAILGLTLLIGFFAILVILLRPIYQSNAFLITDFGNADIYNSNFRTNYYQKQLETLQGRVLVEKVVDKLNLLSHPVFASKKAYTENSEKLRHKRAIIYRILKECKILLDKKTKEVEIIFESPDAELAAKIPNAMLEFYKIKADLEAKRQKSILLSKRLRELGKTLSGEEEKLKEYENWKKENLNQENPEQDITKSIKKQRYENLKKELASNYQMYEFYLTEITTSSISSIVKLEIQAALVPLQSKYKKSLILILSLVAGFFFSIMLAFVWEFITNIKQQGQP